MLHIYKAKQQVSLVLLMLVIAATTGYTQTVKRPQPVWWFGQSGAANWNVYEGTTQKLNNSLMVPTAFHNGKSIKPYASLLMEYRPGKVWGGMLNVAYDNRGGSFDDVMAPCNCPASLSTNLSYITVEPSLRLAPFSNGFYVFAGPTIATNINREFTYKQDKQTDKSGDFSDIRKTVFGAQAGAGFDIALSSKTSPTQMTLSPFASFQTNLLDQPRTIENWAIYTVRAGIALKFGMSRKTAAVVSVPPVVPVQRVDTIVIVKNDVSFAVRAPKLEPLNGRIKETFPLRNSVFFDMGSAEIPQRYVQLTPAQSASFSESQLQQNQPVNLSSGRASRQLTVYHNILNILGDRMRSNPGSTISLSGASDNSPAEGKKMAENVKQYLVNNFDISASRITTEGRDKPLIPSEQPGATKELALLREGDRRVDILSTSPEMMLQVGGVHVEYLKPVQIIPMPSDSLDSHVIFSSPGASSNLTSWSVDVKDEQGKVQHFGPYTTDQSSIPAKTILGNNPQGNYTVTMNGQTKDGKMIRKESSVSLMKMDNPKQEGLRYSILFDFDKSKTIGSYEKFLTDMVAPLITDNATVTIQGHTDLIGDEKYNQTLSQERATATQKILEKALANTGKKGVKFLTSGYGEDANMSPFDNSIPEARFYNRTVIIDITTAQ